MDRRRFALASLGAVAAASTSGAPAAAGGSGTSAAPAASAVPSAIGRRALQFPADFGAHPGSRIEWWYVTGAIADAADAGAEYGFQLTFFRSRTAVAAGHPSRFAAAQLISAHAALTDLRAARLRHDQRIARAGFGLAFAAEGDTRVAMRDWQLERSGPARESRYAARVEADGFGFDFRLQATQPPLLQGLEGWSRKGPSPTQASHYYSQPQLTVAGLLRIAGERRRVRGTAWLDHEWSDSLLDPQAVGWDWVGINFDDASALTAFRLRRADGSALWAGGSFRAPGRSVRSFAADEVAFEPGRTWTSSVSQARYPVEWRITTPVGAFRLRSLLDDQELDSRASTGTVYWEGLSELLDESGRRVGRGYLEMTGYAGRMAL